MKKIRVFWNLAAGWIVEKVRDTSRQNHWGVQRKGLRLFWATDHFLFQTSFCCSGKCDETRRDGWQARRRECKFAWYSAGTYLESWYCLATQYTFHFVFVSDTTNDHVLSPEISFDIVGKRFAQHLPNPRAPINHVHSRRCRNHADNALLIQIK